MSDLGPSRPLPATIGQQAELLEYLLNGCTREGAPVDEAMITLKRGDIADLISIQTRLKLMAPHELAIRRLVTGR